MNAAQTDSEKKLLRYSDHEKQILYGLFKEYGDIIDRHKRRFSKHKSKRSELQDAWQQILIRFNNHRSTTDRNLKQIQKFWLNTRLRKSDLDDGRNRDSVEMNNDGCSSTDQKVRVFAQKELKYEKIPSHHMIMDISNEYREGKWNGQSSNHTNNDYEEADDEDEESNEARDQNNVSSGIHIKTHHMKQEVTQYQDEAEDPEDEEDEVEDDQRNGSVDGEFIFI